MNETVKELPFYIREKVATDPNSCEDELLALSEDYEAQIRLEVARNSSASTNVLKSFKDEKEKQVISALIQRPDLPEIVLSNITRYLFRSIDMLSAEGFSEDDLLLDAYLCSNSVAHSKASPENITLASRHRFSLVKMGAVCNPNLTSENIYEMLVEESSQTVVESLLEHTNSRQAVLKFLNEIGAESESLPDSYLHQIVLMSLPKLRR